ncbi:hypothetical protein OG713_40950 [Streptomyces sp. NBC_00723]|uniref:hypothetical protein n=1 Tax=Streptomyces sp. NBC_00723 TaxID=2903673 RepID=UPI003863D3F9
MNPAGVEELLHAVLGGPLARRSLHELWAASGGTVLYLRELVLGALSGGYLAEDGEIWHLRQGRLPGTARLAEVIGSRLADADATGRPVLELPALCEPLALADCRSPRTARVPTRGAWTVPPDGAVCRTRAAASPVTETVGRRSRQRGNAPWS